MKYAVILVLASLGIIELILRSALVLVTFTLVLVLEENVLRPWCFQMAEKVLNHD